MDWNYLLNACDNEVDLWLRQELLLRFGWFGSELREVDDEVPSDQTNRHSDDALQDE